MISLAPSLALRQVVFFVWVSLNERKCGILAERRGSAELLLLWEIAKSPNRWRFARDKYARGMHQSPHHCSFQCP
jgi:hypothetical protein